jgi:hypothetical protein
MRRFFLTGFPRSRTAWLANLFTTGEILCWHDALLRCHTASDLVTLFGKGRFVGDSDSALMLFYDDVAAMYPGAPWVLVERDADEAFQSMVTKFGSDISKGGWPLVVAAMQRMPSNESMLRVRYEELDDVAVIRGIWNHCMPSVKFDERRWRLLRDMKVERIPPPSDPVREASLAQQVFNKGRLVR